MKQPSILVAGVAVLDKIRQFSYPNGPQDQKTTEVRMVADEPGGTAGNIACLMAYYGWKSYPQAKLDLCRHSWDMKRKLKAWGCDVRFVTNSPDGAISIYHEDRKLDKDGNRKLSRTTRGGWSSRFGAMRMLRERDEVPAFLSQLDFVPDVYFFEYPEAGPAALGKALREKGSLVYFEPEVSNGNEDRIRKILRRIEVCDVMKFSNQSLPDATFCDQYPDKLFIQTCGPDGVRFNLRGEGWVNVPTFDNDHVVDTLGAGDFTTSTFLHSLGEMNALKFADLTSGIVAKALTEAMKVAAKSVSYEGAKGLVWADPDFKLQDDSLPAPEYKGKIVYLHGSASSGSSRTPMLLTNELREFEIVAPDIPTDLTKAESFIKDFVEQQQPDLIIGNSMGGFYSQLLKGWKRICVNPALRMSTDADFKIGSHSYRMGLDRVDGATKYVITQEMLDEQLRIEERPLCGDSENCWGLFADHDTEVTDDSRERFCKAYPQWGEYHGEHRLSKENVIEVLCPMVRRLLGRGG